MALFQERLRLFTTAKKAAVEGLRDAALLAATDKERLDVLSALLKRIGSESVNARWNLFFVLHDIIAQGLVGVWFAERGARGLELLFDDTCSRCDEKCFQYLEHLYSIWFTFVPARFSAATLARFLAALNAYRARQGKQKQTHDGVSKTEDRKTVSKTTEGANERTNDKMKPTKDKTRHIPRRSSVPESKVERSEKDGRGTKRQHHEHDPEMPSRESVSFKKPRYDDRRDRPRERSRERNWDKDKAPPSNYPRSDDRRHKEQAYPRHADGNSQHSDTRRFPQNRIGKIYIRNPHASRLGDHT